MTYTDKDYVEDSFNFKNPRSNNMHNFFYSNIYESTGNQEGMLDKGTRKTIIQNTHKLIWKA